MRLKEYHGSRALRMEDFSSLWFDLRCGFLGFDKSSHRKKWEFAFVSDVISHYECSREGHLSAIGFGVGSEPIPAWLASRNIKVIATDLPSEEWAASGQNSDSLTQLYRPSIIPNDVLSSWCEFLPLDMNSIPSHLHGIFDISWSCGSLEHIGGIEKGKQFILNQMKCLRPGGIAIHTTEFNLTSDYYTLHLPNLCVFRGLDFVDIERRLRAQGDELIGLDLTKPDLTPTPGDSDTHPALSIGGYTITSFVLIIRRGQ